MESKTKQAAQEDLAEFDAQKNGEMAEGKKKAAAVDAETSKQLAAVREQQDDDTSGIEANSELTVAKLESQCKILKSQIESKGTAEADKIKTEYVVYTQTKRADADAEIAKNNAESLIKEAEAEKYAAKLLAAKRSYDQKMRGLQSMRALAGNNNVCVAGNSKDNVMAQLLANQKAGAVLGISM